MTTELVLPLWADLLISALLVFGGLLTLIGCLGLWRFHSFYQRLHGPTLGATMGMVSLAIASMLYFSLTSDGPALHEILIAIFLTLTVPATTLMLARAALYRHRRAGKAVPAPDRPPGPGRHRGLRLPRHVERDQPGARRHLHRRLASDGWRAFGSPPAASSPCPPA